MVTGCRNFRHSSRSARFWRVRGCVVRRRHEQALPSRMLARSKSLRRWVWMFEPRRFVRGPNSNLAAREGVERNIKEGTCLRSPVI